MSGKKRSGEGGKIGNKGKMGKGIWAMGIGCVLVNLLVRLIVASNTHSGYNNPPLYGDYEAQRHWMEVTINLPIHEWYHNTTHNDLLYWGLDYPPLSAFHSFLCGALMEKVEPRAVELYESRGYMNVESKIMMRGTVMISDLLLYFPAVFYFVENYFTSHSSSFKWKVKAMMLLQPALIIIDHGHFQYNCVSLALALFAITLTLNRHFSIAIGVYSMSVNFKVMSLYFAPAFFFYLLGDLFHHPGKGKRMAGYGAVAVVSMLIWWAPFIWNGDADQVLRRVFPIDRGVYEDKVANLWCFISPFIKLKLFSTSFLVKLCAGTTMISIGPMCYALYRNRDKQTLLVGLAVSSFAYYLFSYHVHEKTILLPLLPITLLLFDYPSLSFNLIFTALFSMYPLLVRDGLSVPYILLASLYFIFYLRSEKSRASFYLTMGNMICMIILHLIYLLVIPPAHLPYLIIQLMISYCFGVFFIAFLLLYYYLFRSPLKHKSA